MEPIIRAQDGNLENNFDTFHKNGSQFRTAGKKISQIIFSPPPLKVALKKFSVEILFFLFFFSSQIGHGKFASIFWSTSKFFPAFLNYANVTGKRETTSSLSLFLGEKKFSFRQL